MLACLSLRSKSRRLVVSIERITCIYSTGGVRSLFLSRKENTVWDRTSSKKLRDGLATGVAIQVEPAMNQNRLAAQSRAWWTANDACRLVATYNMQWKLLHYRRVGKHEGVNIINLCDVNYIFISLSQNTRNSLCAYLLSSYKYC